MIICLNPKFVYYAPPKTGSKSLSKLFMKRGWINSQVGKHDRTTDQQDVKDLDRAGYYFFITVRNPYSRLVSMWKYCRTKVLKWKTQPAERHRIYMDLQVTSFADFALDLEGFATRYGVCSEMFLPQAEWFKAMPECNQIITLENFYQDVRDLPFLAKDEYVPHENHSVHTPWNTFYDHPEFAKMIANVNRHYAEDFDSFHYEMKVPK